MRLHTVPGNVSCVGLNILLLVLLLSQIFYPFFPNERKQSFSRATDPMAKAKGRKNDKSVGHIIVTTNVGSLGPNDYIINETGQKVPNIKNGKHIKPSADNIKVRQNVYDTLARIYNLYGFIEAVGLQECSNFDFDLGHLFRLPTATSEGVTHGKHDNGTRGVCTYTREPDCDFEIDDVINELCVTTHAYTNKDGKKRKYAFINVYRNCHDEGALKREYFFEIWEELIQNLSRRPLSL